MPAPEAGGPAMVVPAWSAAAAGAAGAAQGVESMVEAAWVVLC